MRDWRETAVYAARDIVVFALEVGVAVALLLFVWRWGRVNNRFAVGGISAAAGALLWNLVLDYTGSWGFLEEPTPLPLSWQDAGTGAAVVFVVSMVLGLIAEPKEPSQRVMTASAVSGVTALIMASLLL